MPKTNKDKFKILSDNLFPVVGIGASAGGLEAFKKLVKAIPVHSGMAYILVQHLDPAHESMLADLLQRVTKIPVEEIVNNIKVEPDHIYIIPSNKLLTATDGVLQLSARSPKGYKNMPIDLFFSSLAEVHQSHAIGVVLSGSATDGTLGLKAIKDKGGITVAQDLQSAAYVSMPKSAIEAGVVDYILPPEMIAQELLALKPTLKIPDDNALSAAELEDNQVREILSLLRNRRGVDFTYYKQTTIRRRIKRRLAMSLKGTLNEYVHYLNESASEQDCLYHDLLIPVTEFYRDPKLFSVLSESVFPAVFTNRRPDVPIRIWVPGCSTGEEAYSIVMCLHEYMEGKPFNVQVFATDISEIAIAKARSGVYTKSEVKSLSAPRLEKFFTRSDGNFRLNKSIRDSCVFAYHNYVKDPPFARIDLVSCRNSLIYIQPNLQKKALTTFHYSLKEKGFLVLGRSETTGQAAELYLTFDKTNKIYTRKSVKGKFFPVIEPNVTISSPVRRELAKEIADDDFQRSADQVLLSRHVPPSVIVNGEMEIVQFRGSTGIWLEPSSGKPNLNVMKMSRDGLAFELRNTIHKSKKTKQAISKEDIPFQFMGMERLVSIEVIPLLNTLEPHFLILFKDKSPLHDHPDEKSVGETQLSTGKSKPAKELVRIEQIKKELAQTREDMRSITEEQEASNEELQSANEELLSGSEELQSLNEELETSKEEIQTSNEELIIVNQELYDRNEQLNLSRLYSESIVTTIREPLIILDNNMEVRSANKAFYNKFQTTTAATERKLFFEIGNKCWNIPAFRKMLQKILPEKENIIDFEFRQNFPALGERTMVINASQIIRDNSEEQSILIAIEDVTEKRRIDKELQLFASELEKQVSQRTFELKETNLELQNSNKNLEQFAHIASHDLQEPLRKITTFSTLLNDKYRKDLEDPAKELVSKISSASKRMSNLIQEVLNFSRILHNNTAFEKTNLDSILDKVIDDFDLLISEKNAVINRKPLPVIEAIPLQINQLFYNLISNSLKFSRKDTPPVITITTKMLTQAAIKQVSTLNQRSRYCQISFKDNGIGFNKQYAEKIFLIFQRLHAVGHFAGTGIGLALCRSVAVNHHGEIYATAKQNKGALFQIILPISQ